MNELLMISLYLGGPIIILLVNVLISVHVEFDNLVNKPEVLFFGIRLFLVVLITETTISSKA